MCAHVRSSKIKLKYFKLYIQRLWKSVEFFFFYTAHIQINERASQRAIHPLIVRVEKSIILLYVWLLLCLFHLFAWSIIDVQMWWTVCNSVINRAPNVHTYINDFTVSEIENNRANHLGLAQNDFKTNTWTGRFRGHLNMNKHVWWWLEYRFLLLLVFSLLTNWNGSKAQHSTEQSYELNEDSVGEECKKEMTDRECLHINCSGGRSKTTHISLAWNIFHLNMIEIWVRVCIVYINIRISVC